MIRIIVAMLLLTLVSAAAQIAGPSGPSFQLPIDDVIAGNNGNGGIPPPSNPCTGAADFSDGCAVAVFGH